MKGKEIKKRLEDKSGYDKEIIEKEKKYDKKKNIMKNEIKFDREKDITRNEIKIDSEKDITRNEIKFDSEQNIVENKMKYDGKSKLADNKLDIEVGEDVTAYGEFISSYFAWIPLSKQKRRAEELNEMTKNKKESKGIERDY